MSSKQPLFKSGDIVIHKHFSDSIGYVVEVGIGNLIDVVSYTIQWFEEDYDTTLDKAGWKFWYSEFELVPYQKGYKVRYDV